MGLRLLGLWHVVLTLFAVVNAARNQNCPRPSIQNGFFISEKEDFAHDTDLYYGCDEGFQPVEGTWWATVTCQNGTWSSAPDCIEDTACIDPEIPNANYTAFQYVKSNEKLRIRCNTGFEDKRQHATAHCQNGTWTVLPVCEKMESWCGPPPQVPNAVIINQVYKDTFPEDKSVEYMCKSGFELGTNTNQAICGLGQWMSHPSCSLKQTGQGGGRDLLMTTASPVSSGSDNNNPPSYTTIDKCGTPPPIMEAEVYYSENNMFVTYRCSHLYKLKGEAKVKCLNGQWTLLPTCEANFCTLDTSRYSHLVNIRNVYIKSGTKVKLDCFDSTWRTARAVCKDNELYLSDCCLWATHKVDNCDYYRKQQ